MPRRIGANSSRPKGSPVDCCTRFADLSSARQISCTAVPRDVTRFSIAIPQRVVEARHADDCGDFSFAHRPHQLRTGCVARQDDGGPDCQGGQHAHNQRVGVVQRQRQQRAVVWADDSQLQQSLDVGRNAGRPWPSQSCPRSRTTGPAGRNPVSADHRFAGPASTANPSPTVRRLRVRRRG
jgi:hypothetical protein